MSMKTRFTILSCLLLLIGCSQEDGQDSAAIMTFDCFNVTVESPAMTKASIGIDGTVKWDVGDCIGIYSDSHAPVKYYREEDGKFRGEPISGTRFYAFYPWSEDAYNPDKPTELKFCSEQILWSGNDASIPMVAKSTDENLCFKQTTGILHFRIKGDKQLISITLNSKGSASGEDIFNGTGTIDMDSEQPSLKLDPERSYNSLSSNCSKEISTAGSWDLYVPVPSYTTFSQGLELHIEFWRYYEKKKIIKSTDRNICVERAVMKSFAEIDIEDLLKSEGDKQNNIDDMPIFDEW